MKGAGSCCELLWRSQRSSDLGGGAAASSLLSVRGAPQGGTEISCAAEEASSCGVCLAPGHIPVGSDGTLLCAHGTQTKHLRENLTVAACYC